MEALIKSFDKIKRPKLAYKNKDDKLSIEKWRIYEKNKTSYE